MTLYLILESAAKMAPLGTFTLALIALTVAYNQLRTVRHNEAKKQYLSYLDECMKYADFSVGKYTIGTQTLYLAFLNKAFMAFESIYTEFKRDKHWRNDVTLRIYPHIGNLIEIYGRDLKDFDLETYSNDFQAVIKSISSDFMNSKDPFEGELR